MVMVNLKMWMDSTIYITTWYGYISVTTALSLSDSRSSRQLRLSIKIH